MISSFKLGFRAPLPKGSDFILKGCTIESTSDVVMLDVWALVKLALDV